LEQRIGVRRDRASVPVDELGHLPAHWDVPRICGCCEKPSARSRRRIQCDQGADPFLKQ
jgi:hypothetical protein